MEDNDSFGEKLVSSVRAMTPIVLTLGGIVALVADLAAPFGAYSQTVAKIGVVVTIAIFGLMLSTRYVRRLLAPIFATSLILTMISSGILLYQRLVPESSERGVIATSLTEGAVVQELLGRIINQSSEINRNTERILEASERSIAVLEDISDAFLALSQLGGIITDPNTISEFYHNAVIYEARGDTLNAREMYRGAVSLGAQGVDLHERFLSVLTAQEGWLGARRVYERETEAVLNEALVAFTLVRLLPEGQRIEQLERIQVIYPDFSPVYFRIAEYLSNDWVADPTLDQKERERIALTRFVRAYEDGNLYRHFIDKRIADQWLDDARRRLARAALPTSVDEPELWMATRRGHISVNVMPREAATLIEYRLGEAAWRSTGTYRGPGAETGGSANLNFEIPGDTAEEFLDIAYLDRNGVRKGPFRHFFNIYQINIDEARRQLSVSSQHWVQVAIHQRPPRLYFTGLLSHSCALERIEYRFDESEDYRSFPIGPCHPLHTHLGDSNARVRYVALNSNQSEVQIKLTFSDGEIWESAHILLSN